MPWYYAGPEAKPVGPVSLEELHALRVNGLLSPETFVIEYTGPSDPSLAWKRYRELFPPSPVMPPAPPAPSPAVPLPPPTPALKLAPHPLFPSAAPAPTLPPAFSPTGHPVHPYAPGSTNGWCGWGFGLGLASILLLLPTCGLTAFLALPAFFVSIVGLIQLHKRTDQVGRGLAITGLALSVLTLLITAVFLAWAVPRLIKQHEQTTTEQSTNDAD